MAMQRLTYLSGGLPGLILSLGTAVCSSTAAPGDRRHAHAGHLRRVHGLPDARPRADAGADGPLRQPGHRARVVAAGARRCSTRRSSRGAAATPQRAASRARRVAFENVTLTFERGVPVLEQVSFARAPGESLAHRRRQRQRQVDARRPAAAAARSGRRRGRARRPRPARRCGSRTSAATSCSSSRSPRCCMRRWPRTSAMHGPRPPTRRWPARRRGGGLDDFIDAPAADGCDTIVGERGAADVGRRAAAPGAGPRVSGDIRRCSCSTSRRRRSIRCRSGRWSSGYRR